MRITLVVLLAAVLSRAGLAQPASQPQVRTPLITITPRAEGFFQHRLDDRLTPDIEQALKDYRDTAGPGRPLVRVRLAPDKGVPWAALAGVMAKVAGLGITQIEFAEFGRFGLVELPTVDNRPLAGGPLPMVQIRISVDSTTRQSLVEIDGIKVSPYQIATHLNKLKSRPDFDRRYVLVNSDAEADWKTPIMAYIAARREGFQCDLAMPRVGGPPQAGPIPASQPELVGGAKFYGLPAGEQTRRVIYLIDSSGSMNTYFDFVKAELKRVITSLDPETEFSIIFFSDPDPVEMVLNGKTGLAKASKENVALAGEWIGRKLAQSKGGQTRSANAVKRAMDLLGGGPGTVWFLTDGALKDEPDRLFRQLNARRLARVNTILFMNRDADGEAQLKKLAEENGGKYTFVSEAELR